MAWKNLSQRSFADALVSEHDAIKELDGVHDLIDWARLEALLSDIHNKVLGEKAWPPLFMFKALLLQSWYRLSDPALEKQLARDLLFRRFVGLSLSQDVPDHSTLWRFRGQLEKTGRLEQLLDEINDQLAEQGLYIRTGEVSIVDASVIQAQRNRPHKGRNGENTQDPEAAYNVKHGSDGKRKTTYGYKGHINVEEEGLIKRFAYTPGNVHDSNHFTDLLSGTEAEAYADSAYVSEKHTQWLKRKGIKNRLLNRAYRNRPLSQGQRQQNRVNAGTRSIVERVFGLSKLHYGMGKARYLGLERNRVRFGLQCIAYNLKRGVNLRQEGECMGGRYA